MSGDGDDATDQLSIDGMLDWLRPPMRMVVKLQFALIALIGKTPISGPDDVFSLYSIETYMFLLIIVIFHWDLQFQK